jgi:CubicO group peptidase (beta-lactamase class C family)
MEYQSEDIKAVSRRINNSLSDFERSSYIDKKLNYFLRRWELNGASLAIVKDGRLVYAKGYGVADKENDIKVEPWHIFRLASVSKLITATAIMKLKEEGKLSLDDKVFGEKGILNDSIFLDIKDRKMKKITVEHLLRHEAGFSVRAGDPMFRSLAIAKNMKVDAPADLNTTIQYVLKRRLRYKPGGRMIYSNFGYALLSKIIEKKTGMSYEMFVKRNIFEPCGIYDMQLANNTREEKYINEVCYYEQRNSDKIRAFDGSGRLAFRSNGGNNIRGLFGAGAWVGSAAEMLKFVACIDGNDNKPDILSKESVNYMTKRLGGRSPIGWMKIDYLNNWWRTGTLAGSTVLLKKQSNGLSWILVANTSSWRGSKFPKTINYEMSKILRRIKEWPEYDLFNYHNQKPMVINMIDENSENNNRS